MSIAHRVSNFFFRCIQQTLFRSGLNFIWKDKIGGESIWLYFYMDYSVLRRIYPQYQENLVRVAEAVLSKYPQARYLDIGGYIGDTILQIYRRSPLPALAIEPVFSHILKKNTAGIAGVTVVEAFVRGKTIDGALTADVAHSTTPTRRLQEILSDHPLFLKSKLVKIDTDGADFAILYDNAEWLRQTQPILFFEYDPLFTLSGGTMGPATLNYLRNLGYSYGLVYTSTGVFLLSLSLEDELTWQELHVFLLKKSLIYYYDLCLFSSEDKDLFEKIREIELHFFSML